MSGRISFAGAVLSSGTITFRDVVHDPRLQLDFTPAQIDGTTIDCGTLSIPANGPNTEIAAAQGAEAATSSA